MNTATSSRDWAGLIMASNEAAMQWYALVTQKQLPTSGNILTVGPSGVSVGSSANWAFLALLALGAYLIFRK